MSVAQRVLVWIGGIALLAATSIDTIAVIGRHVGLPLTGSIELMQAVVLVSSAIGVVIATLESSHARVRLVVDRLGPRLRGVADRLSDALTLVVVLCLLAGSVWLAADLWHAHEYSELLGVPWALLRLIANVCLLATALILVARVVRGTRS
jgi:TRAP-type C4-dicarboxylate transport system permease small subunit